MAMFSSMIWEWSKEHIEEARTEYYSQTGLFESDPKRRQTLVDDFTLSLKGLRSVFFLFWKIYTLFSRNALNW